MFVVDQQDDRVRSKSLLELEKRKCNFAVSCLNE